MGRDDIETSASWSLGRSGNRFRSFRKGRALPIRAECGAGAIRCFRDLRCAEAYGQAQPGKLDKDDLEEAVALVERLFGCCDRSRGSHGPHAMRLMMPPIARCGRGVVGLWGGAVSEYAFRTMLGSQVMKPRPAADLSLKRPDPIEVRSERRNPQSGSHIFRPYYPVVVEV